MNMLSFVISTSFLFFCRDPGGVLYGPGLSCGFCLPPFQDPQGRVPGSAGSLSRSPVSSEVGTARVGFIVYDYFVTVDAFIFSSCHYFVVLASYNIFFFQWYPANGFHECRCSVRPRPVSVLRGLHRQSCTVLCPGSAHGTRPRKSPASLQGNNIT